MYQITNIAVHKAVPLALLSLFLFGCGGHQTRTIGIDEQTLLVIRGENLVGLTVEVAPTFRKTITSDDLVPYEMGIAGAANKEIENLQTVSLLVENGSQRIIVSGRDVVLIDRTLHFSQGQARELRIRQ